MFSGLGMETSSYRHNYSQTKHQDLPVPFNLPSVLHNLLFEDIELELDKKQEDMLEMMKFSYMSLGKLQQKYAEEESKLKSKIFEEPDNMELKSEIQDIHLDRQQANFDFKNIVILMSDMLDREQLKKLLKFSNINI